MAESPSKVVLLSQEEMWKLVPKGYNFQNKTGDSKKSPRQPDPKSITKTKDKLAAPDEQYHLYECNNISCRKDWLIVSMGQSLPCRDCRNEVAPLVDKYMTPHTREVRAKYKCKRCQTKWERRVRPNHGLTCIRADCENNDRVFPFRQKALPS